MPLQPMLPFAVFNELLSGDQCVAGSQSVIEPVLQGEADGLMRARILSASPVRLTAEDEVSIFAVILLFPNLAVTEQRKIPGGLTADRGCFLCSV